MMMIYIWLIHTHITEQNRILEIKGIIAYVGSVHESPITAQHMSDGRSDTNIHSNTSMSSLHSKSQEDQTQTPVHSIYGYFHSAK